MSNEFSGTTRSKYLEMLIKPYAILETDVGIKFSNKGLEIVGVDSANVMMVNTLLKPEVFDEYNLNDDIIIGVTPDLLLKALTGNKAEISISDEYINIKQDKNYRYKIRTLDINAIRNVKKINIDLNNSFGMSSSDLKDVIKASNDIGNIQFIINKDGICIKSSSDMSEMSYMKTTDELSGFNYKNDSSVTLSIDYMNMLSRMLPQGIITIYLDKNMPMKVVSEDNAIKFESYIALIFEE